MATAAQINEIIKLYVGYYNRAPDPAGLNFWIQQFDGGFGLDAMAVDFATQAETLQNYPFFQQTNPSVAQLGTFVDSIYNNLFNRPPDAAGREFWSTKIASGEFSVGQAISLIIAGASTPADIAVVNNKVAVGLDFFNKANALPTYPFDADDIQTATAIQASVGPDAATVTAAIAQTDTYIASVNTAAGQTLNLTVNPDSLTGGATNDTFNAVVDANAQSTLTSADNLTGGNGTDTLSVRVVSTSNAGTQVSAASTGIEIASINNLSTTGAFVLNTASMNGLTTAQATDANANSTTGFSGLASNVTVNMQGVQGTVGVNFAGARAGTSDAFALTVNNSGTAATPATFVTSDATINNIDTSFEVANITTAGTTGSFINLPGMTLNTLNIAGSQKLTLSDANNGFAALTTVNAGTMSAGGLDLNASGNNQTTFNFTGSGFDDRLVLSNNMLQAATNLTLNGGAGSNDILGVTNFNGVNLANVNAATGFEILESVGASGSLNASGFTGINNFLFSGQTGNDPALTISGVQSADNFIFTSDTGQGDEAVQFGAATVGQTLNLELRAQSGTGGEIAMLGNSTAGGPDAAIGFANNSINTVAIASTGSSTLANVIAATDNNGQFDAAFDTVNGPNTFTISGANALIIGAQTGVDLSATAANAGGGGVGGFSSSVSVNGSAATGALTIAGSLSADALTGGAGADKLSGLAGADVLTGGAGNDQFRFSDWLDGATDMVMDFTSGQDKIAFSAFAGRFTNTAESQAGTTLAAADYVENLQLVANLTGADTGKLVELQSAATQAQITQTTTNGASTATVLVFNSTTNKGEIWFDSDWTDTANRVKWVELSNVTDLATLTGLSNNDFAEYLF